MSWSGRLSSSRETDGSRQRGDVSVAKLDYLMTVQGHECAVIPARLEAGGSHISVVTMGANLTTVDGHNEAIKRWRDVYNSVH